MGQSEFIVLYRWRLRSGFEPQFEAAWSEVTKLLLDQGSLGSRLHRGEDGLWYSYATWPSLEARKNAFALLADDDGAIGRMNEAVEEHFPEVVLDPVADFISKRDA